MVQHVATPVVYAQPQVSTHTITNYNNPEHYTAVSNGAFGPKYIAKNGPVQHIVKREAEAEADPLLYNALYSAAPVHTYSHIAAAPQVYSAVNTVYNTPVVKSVATTVVKPVVHTVPQVYSSVATPLVKSVYDT